MNIDNAIETLTDTTGAIVLSPAQATAVEAFALSQPEDPNFSLEDHVREYLECLTPLEILSFVGEVEAVA